MWVSSAFVWVLGRNDECIVDLNSVPEAEIRQLHAYLAFRAWP